jgi:hypothetical protein
VSGFSEVKLTEAPESSLGFVKRRSHAYLYPQEAGLVVSRGAVRLLSPPHWGSYPRRISDQRLYIEYKY